MQTAATHSAYPRHFDGRRFFNPGAPQARGFADVLRWKLSSRPQPSPKFVNDVRPTVPPARVQTGLRVTFVNHSTVLLQQAGVNMLTDPIWSERTSPLSWIGPRRHRAPGVRKEDLPPIDVVLLSHDHYDHLDMPTLRWLAARGGCEFVAPLRVGDLLRVQKIGPVHELDWGDSAQVAGCTVHCVPAVHFAARGIFDRNKRLWCSYGIESRERLTYFAGDTAFGGHFAEVRKRFGAPQLALLPIGAYAPRWFMSAVHMDPEQAVEARRILGAKMSVGIHYGTFQLADESIDAPVAELRACAGEENFVALKNGEFVEMA